MELRPRRNRRSVPGDYYPAKKNRRSAKMNSRSLTELPVEVQSEILVRLPAKSLLFCKCVCKSLRVLISDPNFVESHLNRFNSPQKSLILDYDLGKRLLHYTSSRNPRKVSSLSLTPLLPKIIDDKCDWVYIVGSCNGLIVVAVRFGNASENDNVFIFWNPVIGQHRYLPKSNCTWFGVHGLGFIPETNDYVVLKVWQTENVMDLYRTSTDSWTTIDCSSRGDLVFKVGHFATPLFFNGAFHWASHTIDDTDIAYYNLKDKEFGVIKAINPNGFDGYGGLVYKKVVLVDGSLAMIYWVLGDVFPFEMWVMNDYRIEETWTRRFLIRRDASDYVERNLGGLWTSGLMVINKVGKRGKRKDYKLFTTFLLYDLNTGSRMNIARVEEMCQFAKVYDFVETLVPVIKAESLAQ